MGSSDSLTDDLLTDDSLTDDLLNRKAQQPLTSMLRFYIFITITGWTIVPEGIIRPVVSVSVLTWFIRYIYYWNLQFLNNVLWFYCSQNFKIIWFSNLRFLCVPDDVYSRNASCVLNLIFTLKIWIYSIRVGNRTILTLVPLRSTWGKMELLTLMENTSDLQYGIVLEYIIIISCLRERRYAPLQHTLSLRPFTAHFVLMAAFSLCMRFSLMFSFYVVPELLSSPPVFSEVRVT
jgi:hypothetical protein